LSVICLVRRDFVSFHKQTILGPLFFYKTAIYDCYLHLYFWKFSWYFYRWLTTAPFYITGINAWGYFADCLTKTSAVFRDNAGVFGKVYFPRLIMPLSIVVSNLVRFGVQMIMFIILLSYYYFSKPNFSPSIYI